MNKRFTKTAWLARSLTLCHWQDMKKPVARAGGSFLGLTILLGLILGIAIGSPMTGVLIGTAIGIAAALLVLVSDIRRPRL